MAARRVFMPAVLTGLLCLGGPLRGTASGYDIIYLMFCTPWAGCSVLGFMYHEVVVVAASGHLDVDWSGWWGNRGGCEECEFEDPQPPPHPEPVDDGGGEEGCGDERDSMIEEYARYRVNLTPACSTFESISPRFLASGDTSHGGWGIDRGLGVWLADIQELSGLPGDARVTSGYRCPQRNAAVGGASQSRHMYGDAMDLYPPPEYPITQYYFNLYRNAALQRSPSYITNWDDYADRHLHVDWR